MIRAIIDTAIQRNIPHIAMEMGYDQRDKLGEYLLQKGAKKVEFYRDLAGLDRGFTASVISEMEASPSADAKR